MRSKNLPTMVLIGTDTNGIVRHDLGSGNDAIVQVTRAFGSFRASISYLAGKETILPEAVYIENSTCMAPSDMVAGSTGLVNTLVLKKDYGAQPTLVMIEGQFREMLREIFEVKGLSVFPGSIRDGVRLLERASRAIS